VKVLRKELDIEPMEKTMKLYRDIQNESLSTNSLIAEPVRNQDESNIFDELKKMDEKLASALSMVQELFNRHKQV